MCLALVSTRHSLPTKTGVSLLAESPAGAQRDSDARPKRWAVVSSINENPFQLQLSRRERKVTRCERRNTFALPARAGFTLSR